MSAEIPQHTVRALMRRRRATLARLERVNRALARWDEFEAARLVQESSGPARCGTSPAAALHSEGLSNSRRRHIIASAPPGAAACCRAVALARAKRSSIDRLPHKNQERGESMRRFLATLAAGGVLLAATASPALADHVGPHQHFVETPSGTQAAVAPAFCAQAPQTDEGLQQFHHNVHTGVPNSTTAFDREQNPVDLTAGGCPTP